ncbi:Protein MAM3 [Colletotrichum trifolii]|uniref:Protein MAM3 n=1 Tax=Colletotrichum trifolii TaxID=5466 RepID=A0A4R8RFJ8_COLTR|nr:Protein MAM3 [Colletotrichum trifolii]
MATTGVVPIRRSNNVSFGIVRTAALGLAKALTLGVSSVAAAPLQTRNHPDREPEVEGDDIWILYIASLVLVLAGGAFAGLTIALMGQDSIYLQVLAGDPDESQSKNAKRVYNLLKKGKHWVLVTLLLSNVIVNESLPVVLDRCLGGGIAAIVGSTVLIVIFGEVVPQSVCVRYGLQIGGFMSKPVLLLMWLMAPVAWPTAKLLDWALGEDHGTIYKKSGLKTLVTLHKSLGEAGERLNQDEVTIISAVLDLKEKPVQNVMTPMDDVFVMAEDTVLDEKTMDRILSEGYSRIPIHATGKPTDFVGMLLVKILITYDPEDALQVRDFPLATLPETRPETSCLDIVNFFQEGKSHMVLVTEYPGADYGALGVVTLEDVIEELIGEEIIDESDVYIDVHKAIRRLTPAPQARPLKRSTEPSPKPIPENGDLIVFDGDAPYERNGSISAMSDAPPVLPSSPGKTTTFLMRRSSAGPDGRLTSTAVPVKATFDEAKQHLKHLGPSNRASNPKNTKSTTVKIKHGHSGAPLSQVHSPPPPTPGPPRPASAAGDIASERQHEEDSNEQTPLMRPKMTGKGGVHAVRRSYGGANMSEAQSRLASGPPHDDETPAGDVVLKPTVPENGSRNWDIEVSNAGSEASRADLTITVSPGRGSGTASVTEIIDDGSSTPKRRPLVRSGSISENVVETSSGVQKIIIQAASSDSDDAGSKGSSGHRSRTISQVNIPTSHDSEGEEHENGEASSTAPSTNNNSQQSSKKKNRRKKRKGKS